MDKILNDWREVRKRWSLWLAGAGTSFLGWFVTAPESAFTAWAMLPEDLKAHLPPQVVAHIGFALLVMSLLAQFVNQRQLQRKAKAP